MKNTRMREDTKKSNNQFLKSGNKLFERVLKPIIVSGIRTFALNSIFIFENGIVSILFNLFQTEKNSWRCWTLRNETSNNAANKIFQSGLKRQNQEMWNLHINTKVLNYEKEYLQRVEILRIIQWLKNTLFLCL